jgi:hypothetical protein
MQLTISADSKIYVTCPAHVATGGPEVLHQLVHTLRRLGHQAFMLYLPLDHPDPVHPQFAEYGNPFVREVADEEKNILLAPETMPEVLEEYQKVQKVLWWLSVDLYYDAGFKRTLSGSVYTRLNKWRRHLVDMDTPRAAYARRHPLPDSYAGYSHLVQSEYARQHLLSKNIDSIQYLSCYLNDEFIRRERSEEKRDIVLYNPNKGYRFTRRLMASSADIEWIAIKNMSRVEVAELLGTAKVYVDFGCHPGKDRIPREAAISGACVITGKTGSACYHEDVPIPEEYKFADTPASIASVIAKIRDCFARFDHHSRKFEAYRERIRSEKGNFADDVTRIFGQLP